MVTHRHIWRLWVNRLHMWGVDDVTAALLEALGPLSVLSAQVVYLTQPLLSWLDQAGNLPALAEMLEDESQTTEFIHLLREEAPS